MNFRDKERLRSDKLSALIYNKHAIKKSTKWTMKQEKLRVTLFDVSMYPTSLSRMEKTFNDRVVKRVELASILIITVESGSYKILESDWP